jgi:hypothetical protein
VARTHTLVPTAALLEICDLTEHFIMNAVRADPSKSFARASNVVAEIRHEIAEQMRPDPNQKEMPIAAPARQGRSKRDVGSAKSKVLVVNRQGAAGRKTRKQGR